MDTWTSILPPEHTAMTITADDITKFFSLIAALVILVLQIWGKIQAAHNHTETKQGIADTHAKLNAINLAVAEVKAPKQ